MITEVANKQAYLLCIDLQKLHLLLLFHSEPIDAMLKGHDILCGGVVKVSDFFFKVRVPI